MSVETNDIAKARAHKLSNQWIAHPLIMEIFEILLELGGSAHCDAVIDQIAWRRSGEPASRALRGEIVQAFEMHLRHARDFGAPMLMEKPFGEHSLRWALTPAVRRFVDKHRVRRSGPGDVVLKAGPRARNDVPYGSLLSIESGLMRLPSQAEA